MRKFGQHTQDELNEARNVATAMIKEYGDWTDTATWNRFRENGIWNDHVSVQSALAIIMERNDMIAPVENNELAYTDEETAHKFVTNISGMVEYWSTTEENSPSQKDRMNGLVSDILSMIDGLSPNMPAMNVSMNPHEDDREYLIQMGDQFYVPERVWNTDLVLNEVWDECRNKDK